MGARSTELSRVTLVGERRRVDLVLPSDEPVGQLLPDVIQLLDDRVAARPELRRLVTASGAVLPLDSTLASSEVRDGAVLRLVRAQDAPAAPVVHDVTDEVAEDLDLRAWRWRPVARRATAGAATVGFAVTAALLARDAFDKSAVAGALFALTLLLAAAGALAARLGGGNRGLATTLHLAAGALGLLAAWTAADAQSWTAEARLAGVTAAVVLTLLLLGLFTPVGRGGLIGAAAAFATTGIWLLTGALQDEPARVGAVLGVVSVVVLGLLPRLALMAAGLTALDDRRSAGASVSRHQVDTALAAAHRGLALATIVTAVSVTAAGLLASTVSNPWAISLTAVLALVLASRSRAFPLVAEVVVLLGAASVLLVRLVTLWIDSLDGAPSGPLGLLALAALLPVGVLAVQPPEHVRVRLRRFVDFIESVGVIALFPLAVGVFGVYGRLLNAF
ncbi:MULTISPECIES: type VII secretion integral membrane protein EccD [Streptomyces]|uniref:Type VII secretion integral membrane protein EccD n=2 Tax=Streptomyces TaxID=1883 RepID=A0A3R7FLC4_9ACTN|nr:MULTISPECIES: type VII secretion integral membrane protein EccD [Streptomyces]KNE84134.1 secretion protein snm4 [Streptomyces fradiae]OFA60655.1 type VII secretion integral membrane protein EccD [Streptomyces fradiae]PQM25380.1 type VII secretion integral membrane protein EccD [Streptomyces xinghaiensis]RKM99436.1 type VII secretion integral membrane protein EccD [Streptomyces xinghaiensis]RNC76334.1 type VII secretion integral membrane protein EccD [Streptomyces xinghaiensis]